MKERKRTAQNDRAPRPPMPARVTQQKNWPAGCSKSPDFSPAHPKLPRQLVLRVGYVVEVVVLKESRQDAQNGHPARPQGRNNRRRTLSGTLRIISIRERSWGSFSAIR
jgi:hypothetical protein